MLDRVAITASPVRVLFVAVAVWLGAKADLFAPVIPDGTPALGAVAGSCCQRCADDEPPPRAAIRTRTPGLQQRFLTRDVVAPHAVRQLRQ